MTIEETSHLLLVASKTADAAAHQILVPDHDPEELESLIGISQRALAFASECGAK